MNEEDSHQTTQEKPGKQSSSDPVPLSYVLGAEKKLMRTINVFLSAIGLGPSKKDESQNEGIDVGTRLAHQRTDLAIERNYMAADRTLMAWIRTTLSMISFGFTIGKLGQVMRTIEVKGVFLQTRMIGVESIAYFLVVLGSVALLVAAIQHWIRMRELYEMGLRHKLSITFIVALLLVAIGGFALSALILAL